MTASPSPVPAGASGVELLREAARLMRERAEASLAFVTAENQWWQPPGLRDAFRGLLLTDGEDDVPGTHEDAEHIASWHPAVALAVANWLDRMAGAQDGLEEAREARKLVGGPPVLLHHPTWDQALTVARAYLGREA